MAALPPAPSLTPLGKPVLAFPGWKPAPGMAGVLPPTWGKGIQTAHLQREIRAEVDGIISRINELIINPTSPNVIHLPDIMVIQEDLDRTCKNINLCTQQGFSWEHKTYGCTKTEMNAWRALVRSTLEELKTCDSGQRNARFTAKQFNSKLCEVNWPDEINALTWQSYFML